MVAFPRLCKQNFLLPLVDMLPETREASCTMKHSSLAELHQYIRHRLIGIHTQQEKVIAAVNNIAKKVITL